MGSEPTMQELLEAIKSSKTELSEKIDSIDLALTTMQRQVNVNSDEISNNKTEIRNLRDELETERRQLRREVKSLQQKQVANGVLLKGFPSCDFDPGEVLQNLSTLACFVAYVSEYYKFSVNIGIDKNTKKPRKIHMMSITFSTQSDKSKLFDLIKSQGHLMLKDLIHTADNTQGLDKIWVEHKLTTENLLIRKRLLELKREGKIEGFKMRSGLFIVGGKNGQQIPSIYDIDQLDSVFPASSQEKELRNKKRDRESKSPDVPTSSKIKKINENPHRASASNN